MLPATARSASLLASMHDATSQDFERIAIYSSDALEMLVRNSAFRLQVASRLGTSTRPAAGGLPCAEQPGVAQAIVRECCSGGAGAIAARSSRRAGTLPDSTPGRHRV